jgi:hypothetical protein
VKAYPALIAASVTTVADRGAEASELPDEDDVDGDVREEGDNPESGNPFSCPWTYASQTSAMSA